ncbi:MAG: hypothetical protein WBO43_07200 [Gemmatimonadota bacterium]
MRLRKGRTGGNRGRRAIAAGLFVVLAGFVGACSGTPTEAVNADSGVEASDADFSVVLGDLTEGLGLTDDQISAVREVMEKYRGQGREPGTLWYAAADLQGVLSSDQIAAIDARRTEGGDRMGDRRSRGRRGSGPRKGFGDGNGNGNWSGAGEGRHGPMDVLDLSEEQLAQLKKIRNSYAPELTAIRDAVRDGSLSREESVERLEAIREAMHEAMQGILTADQIALLEEYRSEAEARRSEAESRREAMRSQWEERRQAERAAMISALGLTVEQVAALDALNERPEREGRPSPEEMQSLRDAHHQALLDVLDDDQEEIWILHNSLVQSFARHGASGRGGEGFSGDDGGRRRGGFSKSSGTRTRVPTAGA